MWRIAAVSIFTIGISSAQPRFLIKEGSREVMYDEGTACPSTWSSRGLLGAVFHPGSTDGPLLWILKSDGNIDYTPFLFPGGRYYFIAGVAERPDKGLEVAGTAAGEDGKPIHFIAHTAPDGIVTTVTITTPYKPMAVTVAPDGVVWTIGWDLGPDHMWRYNVLKRFSPTGNLLSTSNLKVRAYRAYDAAAFSILHASSDRIGWLTTGNEYIEFSLDGREINRIQGPPGRILPEWPESWVSFAMNSANEVVVSLPTDRSGDHLKLWILDRRWISTWSPVEGELPGRTHLFGFDGKYIMGSDTITLPGATPRQALTRYTVTAL